MAASEIVSCARPPSGRPALSDDWFICSGTAAPARIFCFPHEGGSPRAFLSWQRYLGGSAEIVAVCAPGRGHRADERAPASVGELADAAATAIGPRLDRPAYLFGHSLGALVAFEVARRLDSPHLRHLVASGCAAPSLQPSAHVRWTARLRGRAFAEAAGRYESLHPDVATDDDLRELLLADLRADVRLLAAYRYRPGAPLAAGVTLVNGRDDPHVGNGSLERWRRECRAAPHFHWRAGGHFYLERRPEAVVGVLRAVMAQYGHTSDVCAADGPRCG